MSFCKSQLTSSGMWRWNWEFCGCDWLDVVAERRHGGSKFIHGPLVSSVNLDSLILSFSDSWTSCNLQGAAWILVFLNWQDGLSCIAVARAMQKWNTWKDAPGWHWKGGESLGFFWYRRQQNVGGSGLKIRLIIDVFSFCPRRKTGSCSVSLVVYR